jgi:RHS repeat-associated protein
MSSCDLVRGTELKREYDKQGRLSQEILPNGNICLYAYDTVDRLIRLTLPDGSTIDYAYNPTELIAVKRGSKTHAYTYDLAGNIVKETCFNGEEVLYSLDACHRIREIASPHFNQRLLYDSVGNLVLSDVNDSETVYSYDPLYQLISEGGECNYIYEYDSLNNRVAKDDAEYLLNELHQLLLTEKDVFEYDLNGNRIQKNGISYTYDALNRLVQTSGITYAYDSFGRLMTRNDESFIYYKDFDLGTSETLRILGRGMVGLEKRGELYSVISDHRGNVCALVNHQQEQEAFYVYNAFGEAMHTGALDSPWQFSSQRMDPETHLLHFLKRIYDPEIGRWLTPDPAGFVDGPNLYAYVSNNPLTHIDPLGLWSEGIYNFYQQSRQFANSFTRGFVDDTTMGASSLLMGQHNMSGWSSTAGYYAGTATSLGVGLLYGGTWAKGVKYGGKALFNGGKLAYRTMAGERVVKSALDGRRIVKLAQETAPQVQKIARASFKYELPICNRGAFSSKQAADFRRHLWYSQEYGKGSVRHLPDGRIRYYDLIEPPRTQGEMIGRRYVHEFDPSGGSSRGWHETLDSQLNIRQVRPQTSSNSKTHYMFDKEGNLEKIW